MCFANLHKTLIAICCSKSKGSAPTPALTSHSITDHLPELLALRFRQARADIARKVGLDESTRLPACRRYTGSLYKAAGETTERAICKGFNVVILSGAYGILLADEPIGLYDWKFRRVDWPNGLLEEVVLTFVKRKELRSVRAFASASSDYAVFFRHVERRKHRRWLAAGAREICGTSKQPEGPG
jgi:hypothetical protein